MADTAFLDGLRRMFGLQPGESLRGNQLQQQEDQIVNPQLRAAPVQAAQPVPASTTPSFDAAEAERSERQRLLEESLMRLRNGQ